MKNDPRYVRYIVRISGKSNGVRNERIIPHRVCTDADYDEFFPIEASQVQNLKSVRESSE